MGMPSAASGHNQKEAGTVLLAQMGSGVRLKQIAWGSTVGGVGTTASGCVEGAKEQRTERDQARTVAGAGWCGAAGAGAGARTGPPPTGFVRLVVPRRRAGRGNWGGRLARRCCR